jgi:hypothetical protein
VPSTLSGVLRGRDGDLWFGQAAPPLEKGLPETTRVRHFWSAFVDTITLPWQWKRIKITE